MSTKALVLWAARKKWTVRFAQRTPDATTGILNTPDGPLAFRYETGPGRIHLPDATILVNEYGWEVDEGGRTVFRSSSPHKRKEQSNG
ncbi:MAG: hypothetical protein KJZ86_02300 [Caldilineaceae bacterium]|nr:hypothetical protein [Caldilineaceae bacterium]HRJ44092.1 hypothetical protein [Caldilineaceae bacterium]